MEPGDIKRIRKRLGLTQASAGDAIGGGPCAFQKYEAGDLLPSRAISSALALLDHDPSALAVLTRRRGKPEQQDSSPDLIERCVARSGRQGPVLAMLAAKRRLRVAPRFP